MPTMTPPAHHWPPLSSLRRAGDLLPMYEAQWDHVDRQIDRNFDDQGAAAKVFMNHRERLGIVLDHWDHLAHTMNEVRVARWTVDSGDI